MDDGELICVSVHRLHDVDAVGLAVGVEVEEEQVARTRRVGGGFGGLGGGNRVRGAGVRICQGGGGTRLGGRSGLGGRPVRAGGRVAARLALGTGCRAGLCLTFGAFPIGGVSFGVAALVALLRLLGRARPRRLPGGERLLVGGLVGQALRGLGGVVEQTRLLGGEQHGVGSGVHKRVVARVARIAQAEVHEHGAPCAVGVAVPRAVARVAAPRGAILVELEILNTLGSAQLRGGHGHEVLGGTAGELGQRGLPIVRSL